MTNTETTTKRTRAPGGGRKPLYPDEGPMKNLTIRLPPAIKARLDIVFRNLPEFSSRSHVVAAALESALPAMEKRIANPVPALAPAPAAPVPPFPPVTSQPDDEDDED